MKPYGLISDVHCHSWSAFSRTLETGVNSRLQWILNELLRAAKEVKKEGGDIIYFAGDLFHQRGAVDPEVFNPTHDTIDAILGQGIKIIAIPGNHDLKGKESREISNAFQSFKALSGFYIQTTPDLVAPGVVMVPWIEKLDDLKAILETHASGELYGSVKRTDLIIHRGIDGTLSGVPAHGLSAAWLRDLGFHRVFAGDYHHHVEFEGGRVYSIGATTHQTWSDVGTKAGFLIVYPDRVRFCASHAPSFVEVNDDTDPDEIPLLADGNYVRVRGFRFTNEEQASFRKELEGFGAHGVIFNTERPVVAARIGSAATKAKSLEESVSTYIHDSIPSAHVIAVQERCKDLISQVRAKSE